MRKNNGDLYKTIAILGSFRKHYNDMVEADCVYVCDVGGYIGNTVMGELFFLASNNQEVYFYATPEDALLRSIMSKESSPIYSPIELVEMMKNNNDVYRQRTWPDEDEPRSIPFSLSPSPVKGLVKQRL